MSVISIISLKNTIKKPFHAAFLVFLISLGLFLISLVTEYGMFVNEISSSLIDKSDSENYIEVIGINDSEAVHNDLTSIIDRYDGIVCIDQDVNIVINNNGADYLIKAIKADLSRLKFAQLDPKKSNGIILPNNMISEMEIKTNNDESVKVKLLDSENDKDFIIPVVGGYETSASNNMFAYISSDFYDRLEKELIDEYDLGSLETSYMVFVDNGKKDVIISTLKNAGFKPLYNDISSKEISDFIRTIKTIGYIISNVILVLSVWILYRELVLSIKKRERTIAVMKAFGSSNSKIIIMLLIEETFYIISALLFGSIAAYIFMNQVDLNLELLGNINPKPNFLRILSLNILISIGIAIVSMIKPLLLCNKINPIDILKKNN